MDSNHLGLPSHSAPSQLRRSAGVTPPGPWPGNSPEVVVVFSASQKEVFGLMPGVLPTTVSCILPVSFHCFGWEGDLAPVALSC